MATKNYSLPLGGVAANDYAALTRIINQNAGLFKAFVMSNHPDDLRYAFEPETFEVTAMDDKRFTFHCLVHYWEPCCDRDMHDPFDATVPYRIRDNALVFELDETPWVVA